MLGSLIYLWFDDESIGAMNCRSGREYTGKALLALSESKVMAVGQTALQAEAELKAEGKVVELVRPFTHPRVPVAQFEQASLLVNHAVKSVLTQAMIRPVMIVHCLRQLGSPLVDSELKVLTELGLRAGARRVLVSNEAQKYSFARLQDKAMLKGLGL